MLNAITTKLEVDVMQANELQSVCQLAVSHAVAAVVVHPALSAQAIMSRGRLRGKFKIITPVGWPSINQKSEVFGMTKLRGLTLDNLQTDGFEIMLTAGKSEAENRNEAKVISDFIRSFVSKTAEIRFVLGCFTRDEDDIIKMCKVMKDIPMPALLRLDNHLKAQTSKASPKAHLITIEKIKEVISCPLKISGNIDSIRIIASCLGRTANSGASRFAVNPQQAQSIVGELKQQPNELRKLLEGSEEECQKTC